jgi:hypothetical protein
MQTLKDLYDQKTNTANNTCLRYCFLIELTSVCFTRDFHANEKGTLYLLLNTDLLNRSVCPLVS